MKELDIKKVYQCEYCSRVSLSKSGIKTHEHYCKNNPNRQTPCASCKHLNKTIQERKATKDDCKHCYHRMFDYELGYGFKCNFNKCRRNFHEVTFTCAKTNKKMYYAHKLRGKRKEYKEEILKRSDCAMPCKCELFEQILLGD